MTAATSKEAIKSKMKGEGVEFVLAQFVDIHGAPKVKQVPVEFFDDVVEDGAGFAGAAVWGLGMKPHHHDLMGKPDLDTYVRLPWKPNVAVFNCDCYVDESPWPYCARTNLKRMVKEFAEAGYVLNGGFEPEHFLVTRGDDGKISIWDPLGLDTLAKPCYDFKGMAQAMDYLQDIIRYGNQLGFDIYQSDHEDANGQYEINFGWTDIIHAADRLVLFRMITSQVAPRYGAIATYMAKPFGDKTGSGAHFHFHVADAASNKNLFIGDGSEDTKGLGMTDLAYYFVGGLLKHIGALTAVGSPTVNCYRRIQSGEFVYSSTSGYTWTPAFASYGDNNRSQLYRSPSNNRFEDRSLSASVNPYLLGAAYIAAGLDGIKNKIDPGEACCDMNVYELSYDERRRRGMQLLPQNLFEAVTALEADEVVRSGLGPIADEYVALKKSEWSEYMQVVTDWEVTRYLTLV